MQWTFRRGTASRLQRLLDELMDPMNSGERRTTLPKIGTLHGVFAQSRVQPEQVTIFNGWTRLTSDNHGELRAQAIEGLFCAETRFLTLYRIFVNEQPISHRVSVQLSSTEWASTGAILNSGDSGKLREGKLPRGTLDVRLLRRCGEGVAERFLIKNNGATKRPVRFRLLLACPILDNEFSAEEKSGGTGPTRGVRPRVSSEGDARILRFERDFGKRRHTPTDELRALYGDFAPKDGTPLRRALEIRVSCRKPGPRSTITIHRGTRPEIEIRARLDAREELCIELRHDFLLDELRMKAPELEGLEPVPRERSSIPGTAPQVLSDNSTFNLLLGQAMSDLRTLRLPILGKSALSDPERYVGLSAGIPRYIGVFGRDTVISGWQSILFAPELLEPALSRLALLQGIRNDPRRDEEEFRILHERRLDPRSEAGKLNRSLYYGDVTSTPFWISGLSELHRWTGDPEVIRRHRYTLERCCRWVLRRIQQGDGFIYYAPALPGKRDENRNQAWKDSGDAIVDENGRIRVPPLAICEVQGYAYRALLQAAEMIERVESSLDPSALRRAAAALRDLFNRCFWVPEKRFYALALDRHGKQIRSRASNIGHCLTTGILEETRVASVVHGLMAEDLFSGWGIRTLSSLNPAYDPFSYHRGSVWPVENAIISDGFALNGFHSEANEIIGAQLALAASFQHMRLPEVLGGHPKDERNPVPGIYNFANQLQTWSVSAISQFVQILLGVRPRLDRGELILDPQLPSWLSWVELRNLRVAQAIVDLRFERESDGKTRWQILRQQGALRITTPTESATSMAGASKAA